MAAFSVAVPEPMMKRGMISDERIPKNVLRDFQDAERKAVEEYLHYKLREKKSISSYLTSFCNKLIMLDEAQKIGLKVPPTLITGNSGELLKKYKGTRQGIINKPIGIRNSFNTLENVWSLYTNEVEESSIVKDTHFFPSLFQTKIKKRYEIRTFILHNRCWSMAIFSQGNPQTEVDFRHYDVEKPNRRVPYTLPGHIEAKLIELCKKLGLNSGSADFIVGEDMDFYFLEINPVGQFGFVSYNCNYAIEKEIALNLIGN